MSGTTIDHVRRAVAAGALALALAVAAWSAAGCSARPEAQAPGAQSDTASVATATTDTTVPMTARREDLAERLASGDGKRADLADARSRLVFEPVLPHGAGLPALVGLYTRNEAAGVSQPPRGGVRRDDMFEALYSGGLRVRQSRFDRSRVPDAQTFGKHLTANFVTPEKYVRTERIGDVTVWAWDHVTLPETTDAQGNLLTPGFDNGGAQVSWYSDGIGYLIGSHTLNAEGLLEIAKSMIVQ